MMEGSPHVGRIQSDMDPKFPAFTNIGDRPLSPIADFGSEEMGIMGLVRLRVEAQQCFLRAVRTDDPVEKARLTAEGYQFARRADEEAHRSANSRIIAAAANDRESVKPDAAAGSTA